MLFILHVAGLFLARQGDMVEADQGNALVFRALLSLREHAGDDGDLHADLFGESEGRLDGAAGGDHVVQEAQLLALEMLVLLPTNPQFLLPVRREDVLQHWRAFKKKLLNLEDFWQTREANNVDFAAQDLL